MQVDFTGLVLRAHRSSRDRVQGTAVYPKGQPNTDQSRSKVGADHPCYRGEVAQQLFKIEIIMRPVKHKYNFIISTLELKTVFV